VWRVKKRGTGEVKIRSLLPMLSHKMDTEASMEICRRSSMGNSAIAVDNSYKARVGRCRAAINASANSGRNLLRQSAA
jgi:hypothetical protein